jgi:hypothetical protein
MPPRIVPALPVGPATQIGARPFRERRTKFSKKALSKGKAAASIVRLESKVDDVARGKKSTLCANPNYLTGFKMFFT